VNSPDQRLADLFVRYWDNVLSPAERNELAALLAADPAAREEFRVLSVQAVAAAEGVASTLAGPSPPAAPRRVMSRRQLLTYAGGGVAAGVAAAIVGHRLWIGEEAELVRLTASAGEVTLKTPTGEVLAASNSVPPNTVVSTVGPSSSAVLRFADGSDVSLAGDTVVTVAGRGRKLHLLRGTATATVPAAQSGAEAVTLGTTEATCSRLSGAILTLSRTLQTTEVGVQTGRATVADAAGDPLEVVHPGEYLTVRADGRHRKQPVEPVQENCRWDLSKPLPEGWTVGKLDSPTGRPPAIVPALWFDPYHRAEMYQIRSDHRWYQGFAKLHPASRFVVKYWVDRAGPSQLVACVRRDDLGLSDTGVIECNGAFEKAKPGQWNVLDVKAGDMLDNKHTPKFGAPWVAFLIIFNTYKEDLGLRIAEFQVIPPGPAV
jgi:ferric-dicitrate binding protein FerR (iron transport regulator)